MEYHFLMALYELLIAILYGIELYDIWTRAGCLNVSHPHITDIDGTIRLRYQLGNHDHEPDIVLMEQFLPQPTNPLPQSISRRLQYD